MKFVRFAEGNKALYGLVEGDGVIELRGNIFKSYAKTRKHHALKDIRILPPCQPSKVLGLGLNYRQHAVEINMKLPPNPLLFYKATTAIIGHNEPIIIPPNAGQVDYEGELTVVIKDCCRDVTEADALNHVLGYTVGNDVSDRAAQRGDGQWCRAKSFDTFCPIGPFIETDLNPDNVRIETRVNGQLKQNSNTNDMIFGVRHLISFLSRSATLLPGDIIMTGTPQGVGPIKPGDVVEISIEGIGTLRNPVK